MYHLGVKINPKALRKIIDYGEENVIYVSCKPTSLARDLVTLQSSGYEVRRMCCVDMFPGTGHVDTYVHLTVDMEDYYRIKDAETDKKNDSKY